MSAKKSDKAMRNIGEVSRSLKIPQHVLRFWENEFADIQPLRQAGGRRYYRPEDIKILETIKELLYDKGYTIKGAVKTLNTKKKQNAKTMDTAITAISAESKTSEKTGPKMNQKLAELKVELREIADLVDK